MFKVCRTNNHCCAASMNYYYLAYINRHKYIRYKKYQKYKMQGVFNMAKNSCNNPTNTSNNQIN